MELELVCMQVGAMIDCSKHGLVAINRLVLIIVYISLGMYIVIFHSNPTSHVSLVLPFPHTHLPTFSVIIPSIALKSVTKQDQDSLAVATEKQIKTMRYQGTSAPWVQMIYL